MSKIILPGVTPRVILDPVDEGIYNIPKGFYRYDIGEQWTLMDELGRINISWVYKYAMQLDPNITNKKPSKWLANKMVKQLRGEYMNIIGYDPVNTVNGGQRVASSQSPYTASENQPTSNISANGNIQTYGTYMTDRMFVTYASWVSFDFKRYVDDIFIRNASNAVTATGLMHSTDQLHNENSAINRRHAGFLRNISNVPPNLEASSEDIRDIATYVTYLRSDYNVDIDVPSYLQWLCWNGVFYKDALHFSGETMDMYRPKEEMVTIGFFNVLQMQTNGKTCTYVTVTHSAHNAMIRDIVQKFDQIE